MTKYQKIRLEEMEKILANLYDDGRFGRAFELWCARANSKKIRVSAQGRIDCYTLFENENGKRYAVPFECKTNGGRIGDIIARVDAGKDGYIVYMLNYKASTTKGQTRYIAPIIMKQSLFIKVLRECNAIKPVNRNGKREDWAVQPSSKKMFLRLSDYPIAFDTTSVFSVDDFDGIEC